ncbi:hypothetical protein ASPWEDRAFT_51457 [Aspergillus wentii DTO 134E9]|uniref:Xylose isomerase-like TIM barrel domain-containing protein n=1 Tax=Aspergillus wentii DTO 134E9 TaxID=1073089 RepID=A0A1L9RKG2_ASPWE|nr:uncharacterized protein ASPWEDRAFT_51457 [Aspergillus wentii DTO 134E9]OJJ35405.1 hypothetical protein ASPWEDRAFT_51457 [Aspergillus wentii DTO 134E9]
MKCQPAITTVSLGLSNRFNILDKLTQAALHGFSAIELFYDDLEALASSLSPPPHSSPPLRHSLLQAAHQIRLHCDALSLTILNLQPFRFFEGLVDRVQLDYILSHTIPLWIDICHILGADTILVPSNFLPSDPSTNAPRTVGDRDILIHDLRQLALLGAQSSPPIKFAYEALAWGTHISTWEQSYDLVTAVNHPNLGLALDTFNIAGAIYADPTAEDGRTVNAEEALSASLHRMKTTLDLSKLFIVQIADAERLTTPLRPGHAFYVEGQPSRMSWSRNTRLFLCEPERCGYLPVLEIVRTLLDMGWTGYLAYEIFSRTLAGPDPSTPAVHAERAQRSWARLFSFTLSTSNPKSPFPNFSSWT